MYNRASADLKGKPWSEKKKLVFWDPEADSGARNTDGRPILGKWVSPAGEGIDFASTKAPGSVGRDDGLAFDWLGGNDPFIMRPDGKAWLFAPFGLVDGPLPTHYEPYESPVKNILYKQQANPVAKVWNVEGNPYHAVADPKYPIVVSTYRLTEHYLSGTMSRWLPWLAELMPELFCEISPELGRGRPAAPGMAPAGCTFQPSTRTESGMPFGSFRLPPAVVLASGLVSGAALLHAQDPAARADFPAGTRAYSPYLDQNHPPRVLWGDTHLHTSYVHRCWDGGEPARARRGLPLRHGGGGDQQHRAAGETGPAPQLPGDRGSLGEPRAGGDDRHLGPDSAQDPDREALARHGEGEGLTAYCAAPADVHTYNNESIHEKLHELAGRIALRKFPSSS